MHSSAMLWILAKQDGLNTLMELVRKLSSCSVLMVLVDKRLMIALKPKHVDITLLFV